MLNRICWWQLWLSMWIVVCRNSWHVQYGFCQTDEYFPPLLRSSKWPLSPTKPCMYFSSPLISATYPIQLILDLISWTKYGEKYELWSLSLCSAWEKDPICEFIQELWFCIIHAGILKYSTFDNIKKIKKKVLSGEYCQNVEEKLKLSHSANLLQGIGMKIWPFCCNLTAFTGFKCKQNILQFIRNCQMNI